jgi:hypothetical protein
LNWDTPLPKADREKLLEDFAHAVAKRGLQTPVIFGLEMHRPLAFTASQSIVVLGPVLAPLLGIERLESVSRLLQEPGIIDRLIERIDQTSRTQTKSTNS